MTRWLDLISAGVAFGDLLAAVEHGDPLGDPHDHAHVVLDEQDRHLMLVADPVHEVGERSPTRCGFMPAVGSSSSSTLGLSASARATSSRRWSP